MTKGIIVRDKQIDACTRLLLYAKKKKKKKKRCKVDARRLSKEKKKAQKFEMSGVDVFLYGERVPTHLVVNIFGRKEGGPTCCENNSTSGTAQSGGEAARICDVPCYNLNLARTGDIRKYVVVLVWGANDSSEWKILREDV